METGVSLYPQEAGTDIPLAENPVQGNSAEAKPNLPEPVQEKQAQLKANQSKTKENNNERNQEPHHRYGLYQNVLLTDGEHEKLMAEFPADYAVRIDRPSEYMASTGKLKNRPDCAALP